MKTIAISAVLLTAAISFGCSTTVTKDPGTGTPAPAATTPAETPDETAPPEDTTPAVTIKAPTIDGIMKMGGALHVSWTNAEASCDAVELERKTATIDYKVVAKLPGEADNKHDGTATEPTMYTYRARCKKGAVYSAYSNEMSAKP